MQESRQPNQKEIITLLIEGTAGFQNLERREQQEACYYCGLPKHLSSVFCGVRDHDSRPLLEALGFTVGDTGDKLLYRCQPPEGWKLEPTNHNMWNNLVCNGVIQCRMFYTAAFYDRKAELSLNDMFAVRFQFTKEDHEAKMLSPERWKELADAMLNKRNAGC